MSIWLAVLLIVALLAANAFFVATEFALVSSRKDRLESLVAQGKTKAEGVLYATEHLSIYLAGAQFGITVASLILGKVAEPAIASYIEAPFTALGCPLTCCTQSPSSSPCFSFRSCTSCLVRWCRKTWPLRARRAWPCG